jgi:hypothetical protein
MNQTLGASSALVEGRLLGHMLPTEKNRLSREMAEWTLSQVRIEMAKPRMTESVREQVTRVIQTSASRSSGTNRARIRGDAA